MNIDPRIVTRFESGYVPVPESGCWIWIGNYIGNGYGSVPGERRGVKILAHRLSYEIHKGPIPQGLLICHKCDTRLCVNPDHLYAGTDKDNARDRQSRKRNPLHGERNGRAIISEKDVSIIRSSLHPHKTLAKLYGVSKWTIRDIKRKRTWTHL